MTIALAATEVATDTAWAKLNLALHVRRRRDDGYHDIETLFAFCADGDRLSAEPAPMLSLHVDGPFAAGLSAAEDNLILRAAIALRLEAGITAGARIRLDKRLPVAAGIGGGSADAAAALRLLARLWGVDVPEARLLALAAALGADVPACLLSRTCRGDGRGDALVEIAAPELAGVPVLLVNPRVATPTGPVFAAWDRVDRGPLGDGPPLAVAAAGRNDLQPPAMRIVPVIGEVMAWLDTRPGVTLARMSGSGATCFALFADASARDAAANAVPSGWWHLATALR